jgi:hypothetical protein
VIASVDAKDISDRQIMRRFFYNTDCVARTNVAFNNYSQIGTRAQRLCEATRKELIVHSHSKPPARYAWLGNFENRSANLPTLADKSIVNCDAFGRQVLAELTVRN